MASSNLLASVTVTEFHVCSYRRSLSYQSVLGPAIFSIDDINIYYSELAGLTGTGH